MAGVLYPEEQPGILSQPATVNPILLRQIQAQRAANPRPNVTDFMGYGPSWGSYGQNFAQNASQHFPQAGDSPDQQTNKLLGLLGFLGMTKAKPTPLSSGPFAGMTREQFLGKPRITKNSNASDLKPLGGKAILNAPAEPFLGGKYTARFDDHGVAIYDGDKVVASYDKWNTLVVDPKYRRQGIGQEMVYQWRSRHPTDPPASHRTKAAQALQEKVWERIEREAK
jgi:GNAT superfamily N-acetyltransferase